MTSKPALHMPSKPTRSGFTLIEMLIVVVVIGVLAALAIPKFQNTKGKANATALRSDLRNLAIAQESYQYANDSYSSNLASLNMDPSPGVIITFGVATAGGWSATVTHPQAYPITCALFMGTAPALAPATVEGLIACQ